MVSLKVEGGYADGTMSNTAKGMSWGTMHVVA